MTARWRGSIRSKRGWLLLRLKSEGGKWVERSSGQPATPAGWKRAEKQLEELVALAHAREDVTGSPGRVTLRAWAERWLAGRRTSVGADADEQLVLEHVLPVLGELRLEEVPRSGAEALRSVLLRARVAPDTRARTLELVAGLLSDARLAGLLARREQSRST